MEHNKVLGPDDFLAEFYQNFWDVIKFDLLDLSSFLHSGQLELFSLNFCEIFNNIRLMKQKRSNNISLSFLLMLALNFNEVG
jgi:hypothetical protein